MQGFVIIPETSETTAPCFWAGPRSHFLAIRGSAIVYVSEVAAKMAADLIVPRLRREFPKHVGVKVIPCPWEHFVDGLVPSVKQPQKRDSRPWVDEIVPQNWVWKY